MQTARERGADVMLISKQYKWSENSAWYQDASRRAGILVCNPDLGVGDFLETDAGFVWVEVARVRVYSCYFSHGDPFDVFETQILFLEESFSEGSPYEGDIVIYKSIGGTLARTSAALVEIVLYAETILSTTSLCAEIYIQ